MTLLQGTLLPPPPPSVDWTYVLSQMAPVFVFAGLAVVAALGIRWFFRSPIAAALGERVRARTRQRFGDTGEVESERIAGLEHHITALQGQLSELAERVDFAERVLAERRERKLSAGQ
jgi:hypothetical protein